MDVMKLTRSYIFVLVEARVSGGQLEQKKEDHPFIIAASAF